MNSHSHPCNYFPTVYLCIVYPNHINVNTWSKIPANETHIIQHSVHFNVIRCHNYPPLSMSALLPSATVVHSQLMAVALAHFSRPRKLSSGSHSFSEIFISAHRNTHRNGSVQHQKIHPSQHTQFSAAIPFKYHYNIILRAAVHTSLFSFYIHTYIFFYFLFNVRHL